MLHTLHQPASQREKDCGGAKPDDQRVVRADEPGKACSSWDNRLRFFGHAASISREVRARQSNQTSLVDAISGTESARFRWPILSERPEMRDATFSPSGWC